MKNIVKILLAVLTGSRACSRSEKRTSLFFSFLIAAFVLSLTPTVYVCAQGHIETPAERKARQEREAAAKRKRQQEEARKRRDQAAMEQAANKKWIFQNDYIEGLAMVSNGKIGFVDETGKLVIPCQWYRAMDFENGIAWVADAKDKWGFIDKTGKIVSPCRWKNPGVFINGFAEVEDFNGKKHKIDKTGKIIE